MAPDSSDGMTRAEVIGLFVRLDRSVVEPVVIAAMRRLGMRGLQLPHADVLRLLDHIASERGAIGVTARFAKARVLLGTATRREGT